MKRLFIGRRTDIFEGFKILIYFTLVDKVVVAHLNPLLFVRLSALKGSLVKP